MSSSPLSWGECQGSGVQSAPLVLSHPLPKALGTLLQTPFTLGPRSPWCIFGRDTCPWCKFFPWCIFGRDTPVLVLLPLASWGSLLQTVCLLLLL